MKKVPVMLDLSGRERATFAVRLPRRRKPLLLLLPTKAESDRVLKAAEQIQNLSQLNAESLDALSETAATILSCNTKGKRFSAREVAKLLTLDDMTLLFVRYLEWLDEVSHAKN